jgi:hypothetical protein
VEVSFERQSSVEVSFERQEVIDRPQRTSRGARAWEQRVLFD